MFDFEEANKLLEPQTALATVQQDVASAVSEIKKEIDLEPLIQKANDLIIETEDDAMQALSMALQARKLYKTLDNSRKEIIRPQLDFQKAVNKLVKDYETKLKDIEENLTRRIGEWIEEDDKDAFVRIEKMQVEDGSLKRNNTWEFDVVDSSQVPFEFMCPDVDAIEKAIKGGLREIPGIEIKLNQQISLRVKN